MATDAAAAAKAAGYRSPTIPLTETPLPGFVPIEELETPWEETPEERERMRRGTPFPTGGGGWSGEGGAPRLLHIKTLIAKHSFLFVCMFYSILLVPMDSDQKSMQFAGISASGASI